MNIDAIGIIINQSLDSAETKFWSFLEPTSPCSLQTAII